MATHQRFMGWMLVVILLLTSAGSILAQEPIITAGSPVIAQISAEQPTLRYSYVVPAAQTVTLQALSDTVAPTLRVLLEGDVIEESANLEGATTLTLTVFLSAGTYTVEVGSANGAAGTVFTLIESEIPVSAEALFPQMFSGGQVSPESPAALFTFGNFTDFMLLYVDSVNVERAPLLRVVNTLTGESVAQMSGGALGIRLRFAPGNTNYTLEVIHSSTSDQPEGFSVCLTSVSSPSCETSANVVVPPDIALTPLAPVVTAEPGAAACTVASNAGGAVNIRQSATTNSIILGSLPNGVSAEVVGRSPDGTFFNILHNGINGWVSASVVTASGDCGSVAVVNPPAPIVPTAVPPTSTPIQPMPTAIPPTVAPSGPCLIRLTAPTRIYSIPNADISNLFDEVGAGGELIPTGRLADNSWWHTNYAGAWIQTSTFGVTAQVTGDCSALPIVTP